MGEPIRNIVIVGGGTAGWMAAAALSRFLESSRTSITLVESEAIGTIGVGEATIPQIAQFNAMLGLDEADVLRATSGTYKLGIEFRDWARLGDAYFHPFGEYGFDLEGLDFHHYWLRLRKLGGTDGLDAYSLNALAAYAGKFFKPDGNPNSPLSKLGFAYHFDATLYGRFLRGYSEERGVSRVEGLVVSVEQDAESGHVRSVTLEDGRTLKGDLFIDCTGFGGLLIEKTLQTGYENWSELLPMNRAVALPTRAVKPPRPYTVATARTAGWTWRIPLQHRTGNGHVYCADHMEGAEAEDILVQSVDGEPIAEPRHLRFTTGVRRKLWNKNVVAIGLSAGFLEPLESTSIHMIQSGVAKLIALFPDTDFDPVLADEYNRILSVSFSHIRDFIVLHYIATEREDSEFWRRMKAATPTGTLAAKMELLEHSGRFFRYDDELFSVVSWLAVMEGQRRGPRGYNPVADKLSERNLAQSLANMRGVFAKTSDAMPSHVDYIARFCRSDVVVPGREIPLSEAV